MYDIHNTDTALFADKISNLYKFKKRARQKNAEGLDNNNLQKGKR